MTFGLTHLRNWGLTALLVISIGLMPTAAWARKIFIQQAPPTYVQQAPAGTVYAAPAPTGCSAPLVYSAAPAYSAPGVYSAPAAYSAAPAYSAPAAYSAAPAYSAPAATQYAAPVTNVGYAPATANAPGGGSRIKPVDRNDIIGELRKEDNENDEGSSTRERRKSLRESARAKYAESIGVEDSELTPAEEQDIDVIVNSIVDSGGVGQAPGGMPGYGPTLYNYAGSAPGYGYGPNCAPSYAPPMQPAMIVQPLVPVQLLVPVQPKHHLFRH